MVKGKRMAPERLFHFMTASPGDVQPYAATPRHDRWPCLIVVGIVLLSWIPGWVYAAALGDAAQGQRLYRYYCAACHGTDGAGDGRNAPYLEHLGRAPRDHTDVWYMNQLSDPELYRAISEGKRRDGEPPFMPWWGYTLTPEEIWSLVAFIRGLTRETME
jgi:mono/diheme cytochrome c family protein